MSELAQALAARPLTFIVLAARFEHLEHMLVLEPLLRLLEALHDAAGLERPTLYMSGQRPSAEQIFITYLVQIASSLAPDEVYMPAAFRAQPRQMFASPRKRRGTYHSIEVGRA